MVVPAVCEWFACGKEGHRSQSWSCEKYICPQKYTMSNQACTYDKKKSIGHLRFTKWFELMF